MVSILEEGAGECQGGVVLVDQEGSHCHPSSPSSEARANITVVLNDVLEQEGPTVCSISLSSGAWANSTGVKLMTNNMMLEQNKVNKQCFLIIQIYDILFEWQSNLVYMYYFVILYIKNL
jgi:hypothetical protein